MFALFKKWFRRFVLRESLAKRLYRGITNLDQQALEIRTVVTRVMSFVEDHAKATLQVGTNDFLDLDRRHTWRLCITKDGEIELRLVTHYLHFCGDVVFCTAKNTGFRQPSSGDIALAHQRLELLVRGTIEKFPLLKSKLDPYFEAADK